MLFCKGCPSSDLHWLATLCTFASLLPVESSCVFHQLGSSHISAASAHPLFPTALGLGSRERCCIMGSVRVTKEGSYSGWVVHMRSRRQGVLEPSQIICVTRKLVRGSRFLFLAAMNPTNLLDIITLDFLIDPLVLQKFNCLCPLLCRQELSPELCCFLSHAA